MDTIDELEPRNGSRPPLPHDATLDDVIDALNGLAKAARTHSIELEGIRNALREHGTRIETFCERVEKAIGIAKSRDTEPPPFEGSPI